MADKNIVTNATEGSEDVLLKAKSFWDNYGKPIIFGLVAIVVVLAAWFGYQNYIKAPKEKKAEEAIFPAETLFDKMATTGFSKDSVNIVLNGGSTGEANVLGLLKIMNTYSGTAAANRATYMTGASYLQIKDFDKAIKYLKEFDGNGATQVESKADIMLGHAYAEQKKVDDALSYYKKAATVVSEKDEALASDALFIAASYADAMGKTKDAIELYQQLKDKYPNASSVLAGEVDKYLARLGVTN